QQCGSAGVRKCVGLRARPTHFRTSALPHFSTWLRGRYGICPSAGAGRTGGTRGREKMRILVADDEAASARSLAELLTLIGHQVVGPARDGAEAVALAAREKPDLAIFDVEMPHMSGLEAIDRITRARPIPVIVLTGHDCPEFVDRAAELPVFNY